MMYGQVRKNSATFNHIVRIEGERVWFMDQKKNKYWLNYPQVFYQEGLSLNKGEKKEKNANLQLYLIHRITD